MSVNKGPCATAGWDVFPFGFDAPGALGLAARGLCQKLAKHLAMQTGAATSSAGLTLTVGQHISLALAKARGEMLSAGSPVRPGRLLL